MTFCLEFYVIEDFDDETNIYNNECIISIKNRESWYSTLDALLLMRQCILLIVILLYVCSTSWGE